MNRKASIYVLAGALLVGAALAGCAEPDQSTNDGRGEAECDDENNVDVGAPDDTTDVGGVACEDAETDMVGGA